VWLRLAEHLGRIENPDHIGAWLATTAKRESLRIARGGARTVPMDHAALLDFAQADEASPEQAVLQAEQARLDAQRARRLWRARLQRTVRALPAAPAGADRDAAAKLCRGRRRARPAGREHRADTGALPPATAAATRRRGI
jgi:DNA-directed RNA polymerase specialized sigma24 family protein